MIIDRIRSLNLPSNEFVVVGSAVLDVVGIREAQDVDLLVAQHLFDQLADDPKWEVRRMDDGRIVAFLDDTAEAMTNWRGEEFSKVADETFERQGIRFVNIEKIREWKQNMGRPKDLRDVALIDEYLHNR